MRLIVLFMVLDVPQIDGRIADNAPFIAVPNAV
jgi:hypothetical protein